MIWQWCQCKRCCCCSWQCWCTQRHSLISLEERGGARHVSHQIVPTEVLYMLRWMTNSMIQSEVDFHVYRRHRHLLHFFCMLLRRKRYLVSQLLHPAERSVHHRIFCHCRFKRVVLDTIFAPVSQDQLVLLCYESVRIEKKECCDTCSIGLTP